MLLNWLVVLLSGKYKMEVDISKLGSPSVWTEVCWDVISVSWKFYVIVAKYTTTSSLQILS